MVEIHVQIRLRLQQSQITVAQLLINAYILAQ
jgi:hypothetical protein